jgi:hypothetical protein
VFQQVTKNRINCRRHDKPEFGNNSVHKAHSYATASPSLVTLVGNDLLNPVHDDFVTGLACL